MTKLFSQSIENITTDILIFWRRKGNGLLHLVHLSLFKIKKSKYKDINQSEGKEKKVRNKEIKQSLTIILYLPHKPSKQLFCYHLRGNTTKKWLSSPVVKKKKRKREKKELNKYEWYICRRIKTGRNVL